MLRGLDNVVLTAINAFQAEYKQHLSAFLSTFAAHVAAFNLEYVGPDYTNLIAELNTIPGVKVSLKVAGKLYELQIKAITEITASIKGSLNAAIKELLDKIEIACLPELIELVTSGFFANQVTTALSQATSEVSAIVNVMLAKQQEIICKLKLPSQAQALADNFLQTNAFALIAFVNTEFAIFQAQIDSLLVTLLSSLKPFLYNQVLGIQNLIIVGINKLAAEIFGTTSPTVPPVVVLSTFRRAPLVLAASARPANLLANTPFVSGAKTAPASVAVSPVSNPETSNGNGNASGATAPVAA